MDSYVLAIPDLRYVITPEAISRWELFWRHADSSFPKVEWQAAASHDSFVFTNNELFPDSPLKEVRIDFHANCIIFKKMGTEEQEFEIFLRSLMDSLFIQIPSNEMHFIVSPKEQRRHNLA
ncbi:hypothetical protein ACSFXN_01395 [Planococcus sp. 1R117A]|uniref:hypothetical protein n=1 Tax=Planococcus sp. 1R117A TaxID=3447020 RepID=UPI003EDBFB1E